jgi:hypothetical protein
MKPMLRKAYFAVALLALAACGKDPGQRSAEEAKTDVASLIALTERDVAEIERGLPEGAKKLGDLLAKEKAEIKPPAVRSALLRMRQQVPDLGIAKSTFFAFADPRGIAIRNDFEQDTMGGKDLVAGWPGLKPVTEGAPYVSTTGSFPGPPSPLTDKEWVAAVPVQNPAAQGMLVTGWTYRRFAYHLQVTLQRELQDRLMRAGEKGKMPIVYVCLFDREEVYGAGAPGATRVPEVDEKALKDLGLHARTEAGPAAAPIRITDRAFGWAAARLSKLGPDVGVVVLRSEL